MGEQISKNPILRYFNKFERYVTKFVPDSPRGNYAISQYRYFLDNFRFANLKNPKGFPEYLMRVKLSETARNPLFQRVSDKELVKDYVHERTGPGNAVETLGILRTNSEIDSFSFPKNSVAKATHLSGAVVFVRDEQPSVDERDEMKAWLATNYFHLNREPNYKNLEPKVIIEPFIGVGDQPPEDVKVHCFHGEPRFIQVDYGRHREHLRDFYDLEGRRLEMTFWKPPAKKEFPYREKIQKMIEISRPLSQGFDFLRVDFYVVEDGVLVGELTHFPTNCVIHFEPREMDEVVGRMIGDPSVAFDPRLAS